MREIRVCATSDFHGHLPDVPDCDVLLIAGDIGLGLQDGRELQWWSENFHPWLTTLAMRKIVTIGIAGNHDFLAEDCPDAMNLFPWIYLCDSGVELGGVKFWGSPWTPWFGGWAFNSPMPEPDGENFLDEKFSLIPDGTDILIAHGPPAGFHDRCGRRNVGSISLNKHIQRVNPTLACYGHIHHGYGVEQVEGVTLANVSHTAVVNNHYIPKNQPIIFDI